MVAIMSEMLLAAPFGRAAATDSVDTVRDVGGTLPVTAD